MTIEITLMRREHIDVAAGLFAEQVRRLREQITALPETLQDPAQVQPYLERILERGAGLAAMDGARLAAYWVWMPARDFRETGKAAVYVPEWGHAAADGYAEAVYGQLLRGAAQRWAEQETPVWAVSCLTNNHWVESFFFHNGFGMIVQDAVRSVRMPEIHEPAGLTVRRCSADDAGLIAELDAEHCDHYSQPPVLMTTRSPETTESVREFLSNGMNSYWLALWDDLPGGFLRFEQGSHGAAAVVRSEKTIAINGAYIRPALRGQNAAAVLLKHALDDYARLGFLTCSVDYETINPHAFGFWGKYFQPVCFSAVRYPEKFQSPDGVTQ